MKDPIGRAGGLLNEYGYLGGNPIAFVDLLGLLAVPLSQCVKDHLAPYFPGLDLDKITVGDRIPFYVLDPGVIGYGYSKKKIWIKGGPDQFTSTGISLIAHELQHLYELNQRNKALWGIAYLIGLVHPGYDKMPKENRARAMENRVLRDLMDRYGKREPCE